MEAEISNQTTVETSQTAGKKNNFLVSLLSILLLLSCIIAGFFAYQTQKLVKEITETKNQPVPTAIAIPTTDPTADWKTYIDQKYEYSFKYPPTEEYIKENDTIGFYGPDSINFQIKPLITTVTNPSAWWLNLPKDSREIAFSKICYSKKTTDQITDSQNHTIVFIQNVLFLEHLGTQPECVGPSDEYYLVFAHKEHLFKITYNNSELSREILSTFKFTDSESAACTEEAKICPDGSSVGRIGPNCEFAKCPATSPQP